MIDKHIVREMAAIGFSQKQIAERLQCSTRQVRRIARELNLTFDRSSIDAETENVVREFCATFLSAADTARKFGITKQAILKARSIQIINEAGA